LSTSWSYLANSGDRRLAGINNVGLSSSQYSNYQFATTPENLITAITETSDASAVYPAPLTQTASYNNLNQLTNLSGQALTFDADGNILSDGQRNFSWDAENRLVGITYPGQPGKQTALAYDGLGRRTAILSTPAGGGGAVTVSYIWCGTRLCQAQNASTSTTREYLAEGEIVSGTPSQTYYYGLDQIGSVRRVFASTSSAPAYSYDAYGNALQSMPGLADFDYARMFYNADSGLYLTQYRAYDPIAGRWLSRDPLGEYGNQMIPQMPTKYWPQGINIGAVDWSSNLNLYGYVGGNPISLYDPNGKQGLAGPFMALLIIILEADRTIYYSHPPELPPPPPPPPPLFPNPIPTSPTDPNCYSQRQVRNYTPIPHDNGPPEPPEPHEPPPVYIPEPSRPIID
jgi:RHS repeat-associated protein